MSRTLTSAFQSALAGTILFPVFFFEGEFATGTLRLCSGYQDRTWNGHTWTASGWLVGLSEVEETTETKATSLTAGMQGVAAAVSLALGEFRRNRPLTIWLGLLDAATQALIADPVVWYSGLSDLSLVSVDPARPNVQFRYKSQMADLERARVRRQTPEDQAIEYPGDKFFDSVGPLSDAVINWGA